MDATKTVNSERATCTFAVASNVLCKKNLVVFCERIIYLFTNSEN